jgi:hypothetical protein
MLSRFDGRCCVGGCGWYLVVGLSLRGRDFVWRAPLGLPLVRNDSKKEAISVEILPSIHRPFRPSTLIAWTAQTVRSS